jgi:hypothetical protein
MRTLKTERPNSGNDPKITKFVPKLIKNVTRKNIQKFFKKTSGILQKSSYLSVSFSIVRVPGIWGFSRNHAHSDADFFFKCLRPDAKKADFWILSHPKSDDSCPQEVFDFGVTSLCMF